MLDTNLAWRVHFLWQGRYTYEQKLEGVLNITDKHLSIKAAAKLLGCGKTPLSFPRIL